MTTQNNTKARSAARAKTPAKATKDAKSAKQRHRGKRGATSGEPARPAAGGPDAKPMNLLDAAAQ